MAQIQRMEPGKLTAYHLKNRPGKSGPYYKLQHHENGKNLTQYIRPEDVAVVQAAVDGYNQFEKLVSEYSQIIIQQTREERRGGLKKKTPMFLLAQDEEIERLITRFTSQAAQGAAVQELELLLREALRKPANELIGVLLQNAASQIDQNYPPKPGRMLEGDFPD